MRCGVVWERAHAGGTAAAGRRGASGQRGREIARQETSRGKEAWNLEGICSRSLLSAHATSSP